ncbi:MAG TPA: D-aminoacylase [Phycisphaerae bacterium]|nr:D-aminoacylase [Phycisphaerae bacterium]HOJ73669.1 D-aminoacylase [Phycisphaerae bacterium]HOQ87840.1 D-aminoacylase [Phycisphaerae bacterium]HPU25276.1 D-aminoacylase [Phycisphaerae bacterium]HQE28652.1 D-aminoacylase [Phycisphaerae bacterium]
MAHRYDVLIRNGMVYDGSGSPGEPGDVGISGDRIVAVNPAVSGRAAVEIDATGMAVAPGFINMLSWAGDDLLVDGRSQSDIRQGVTLEVMGEGSSMGPWNESMKQEDLEQQGDIKYEIAWTTLGEYLDHLVRRGVSCNVASFVGATTVRIHELGYANRPPNEDELRRMQMLVRQAMEEGAMGVASSLIYSPAAYADTQELIALAKVAAEYGGMYISHIRNEADTLLEAFDEFLTIAREASIAAEIYHLKASGQYNWNKLDALIERIERARKQGLAITADMYTYHASSTGLDAIMPPWVQEGGHRAWIERLKDPATRARVRKEMNEPGRDWDNGYLSAGGPEGILLIGFKQDALKPLTGKSLAEVAAARGKPPEEVAMDLVIEDDSRVAAVFFSMSEDNIRKQIRQPWMSFCSDGGSISAEGVFLKRNRHPRTYGTFARLLGKYVRDEKLIPLEEAIRRLTSLPAANLKLRNRGRLAPEYFADVVVFDPVTVRDNATFDRPHQYATGVAHVFVNGEQVIRDGEHTGALPGRVVRGPGWRGKD